LRRCLGSCRSQKCEDDGLIVARLGVLDNDLGKVWQPTQPHLAVRQLRDWFAQFPYLSKLRDPVLARAISEALARGADANYAIADRWARLKIPLRVSSSSPSRGVLDYHVGTACRQIMLFLHALPAWRIRATTFEHFPGLRCPAAPRSNIGPPTGCPPDHRGD
jgi:hypothetical protein